MGFLNPYFLVALAGIAVPILIHLLTRDRVRRVGFSTLRFFAKVSQRVLRRKRLREMLLLALRAAVCGLVALAFARPILRGAGADAGGRLTAATARVLLLDVSASMSRPGAAQALRDEARRALDGLSGTDLAALVTFDDVPRVEVPLTGRLEEVRSRLASLSPGHGGTDIAEAIRKADAALRPVSARRKEILLVSDLQRVGWQGFKGDWELAPDTRLVVRPVAPPEGPGNLAVVEADAPSSATLDGLPRTVAVRVANYADRKARDVEVVLAVGGERAAAQKVHIRAGESVPVRFRHVFAAVGDNPATATVTVAGPDAVAEDNVFHFNTRVVPRVRAVVVSGPPAGPAVLVPTADGAQDAAFFLEKALAPVPESPFLVRRVATADLKPQDLADAQVAVLADVKEVPAPVAQALADLLGRGGGILLLPGPRTDAETFGRVFEDLAPCRLRVIVRPGGAEGEAAGASLARVDFEHPVFEVFQHPHYGDLSLPKFRQYWEVADSQRARVLARFDDGRPAVLEREIGRGVSMMLASPVDLRWNNLPLRAVFLPYLHQTVRYLAVRTERRTLYRVGDVLPVPEGWTLTGPDGKAIDAPSPVALAPGFYAARGAAGSFQFAVNRDPRESDPAVLAADEIVAAVQAADAAVADQREAALADDAARDRDDLGLWWYVVLAVTALVLVELWVANGTSRH